MEVKVNRPNPRDAVAFNGPRCQTCGRFYIDTASMGPGLAFRTTSHRCGQEPAVVEADQDGNIIQPKDNT